MRPRKTEIGEVLKKEKGNVALSRPKASDGYYRDFFALVNMPVSESHECWIEADKLS